ncbi:hypothetical protein THAOC_05917 [Thalassiosira oceanica]|uniref:Reverse transcriptase Ty1/copia-type domain-containing protein n=1 Tax=Thalassiosira oceanica TaxID=159749 RepID=K0T1L8_THAOC|nr:hypothetical protein THAOC_05917 [Thalassiosira oceanica]|eukprot:EJK72543.1 hypothetical protein THAOC_05917 [Thalassiosira oceanica]
MRQSNQRARAVESTSRVAAKSPVECRRGGAKGGVAKSHGALRLEARRVSYGALMRPHFGRSVTVSDRETGDNGFEVEDVMVLGEGITGRVAGGFIGGHGRLAQAALGVEKVCRDCVSGAMSPSEQPTLWGDISYCNTSTKVQDRSLHTRGSPSRFEKYAQPHARMANRVGSRLVKRTPGPHPLRVSPLVRSPHRSNPRRNSSPQPLMRSRDRRSDPELEEFCLSVGERLTGSVGVSSMQSLLSSKTAADPEFHFVRELGRVCCHFGCLGSVEPADFSHWSLLTSIVPPRIVPPPSDAIGSRRKDLNETNMQVSIHEDNAGALILAKTLPPGFTPRSKHYAVKTIWFREQIVRRGIKLCKIDTKEQLGDLFTKGLPLATFVYLRGQLMGW